MDVNDDLAPLPAEDAAPPEPEPIQTAVVAPADDESDAVELKPGERYVPLSALQATRAKVAELKGQAERATQLEAELNAARPYVDFLRANQHLLTPQPVAPAAPVAPTVDPQVESYAKRFDLYTQDGRPDVERAQAIIEDNRRLARTEAESVIAPIRQQADAERASAAYQWLLSQKDADGNPLSKEAVDAVVTPVLTGAPDGMRVLADPQVMQLLRHTAMGYQAAAPRKTPIPAPGPVLQTEPAGGGRGYTMSDSERRMARNIGRSDKDWSETSARFKPGTYNSLE